MKLAIAGMLTGISLVVLAACNGSAQPDGAKLIAYQVDAARERSWWLTKEGAVLHSAADAAKKIALPEWLWAADPYCPPGLAIGPDGEAVVTSNVVPVLWRIDPRSLAVTIHELALNADTGKDVGFAAIVYSPEQKALIAYSEQRSVWKIDLELKGATKLADTDLSRPGPQRARNLQRPCAELPQRLGRIANTND